MGRARFAPHRDPLRSVLRRHIVWTTVVLLVVGIPFAIFVLVGVPHVFRGPSNVQVPAFATCVRADSIPCDHAPSLHALVTGVTLVAGNRLTILSNGAETYPRIFGEMRAARRSITVQMYSGGPGVISDSVAAIMMDRSRAGVSAFFLYDAFGGHGLTHVLFDSLRAAGVHVAAYKPIRWHALDRANNRTHVRSVVVDGAIGFTGGFGFDDRWLGDGLTAGQWRETNARVEGPVVQQMQATFVSTWAEATGRILADTMLLAESGRWLQKANADAPDAVRAGVVMSVPADGTTTAARLLAFMIARAHTRLYITNAYFVPPPDFTGLLISAARRGVDVRILTNGPNTDVRSTWLASHTRYATLLRAGVRIYEYAPTTLHSKTIVTDGEWCTISTINFDNRSLAYNTEIALQVFDSRAGAAMDSIFLADLSHADEIRLPSFLARSRRLRVREWLAGLIADLL